jgi:FlaA1/EpsC-like NDP-sugar epimerase
VQNKIIHRLLGLSRTAKRIVALSVDTVLCIITVAAAYALRLDGWVFPYGYQWLSYAAALVFSIPLFITFGFYRAIFRYAGWGALVAVARACALYGILYAFVFTLIGVITVPRTTGLIQPILLFLTIGASRAIARYWLSGRYSDFLRVNTKRRVLIYGAGSAGRQLAAGLANSEEMQAVAFVDDDTTLHKSVLNGKVIYPSDDLPALIKLLGIDDLLLALPSATRSRRNEILEAVRKSGVSIRTLPGIMELAQGRITVNDLKELDIVDLLGRDPVPPSQILLSKNITGRIVLVTGAGGSIGSELCRQVQNLQPSMLLLLEQSEFNLYAIHQELQKLSYKVDINNARIIPLLGSVQDTARVAKILATWKPDTIYHAAAYKHVPLVEHNPAEAVRNNIFGTLNIAKLARKHKVQDFVLISTDKAVRPTNVMGATKRVAEQILQALAAEGGNTRFSMVRFGNVLGSSGSVVPQFRKQIKAGGPVTITHSDITRYFMTIPEASQLVIQAGAMAHGGEVFVLDMGEPVRIIDLAKKMIELCGLTERDTCNPQGDIEIEIVGLRPGEKLYEELLIGDNPETTGHIRIMKARDKHLSWQALEIQLIKMEALIDAGSVELIRAVLKEMVPEFDASGQEVDWIYKEEAAMKLQQI